MEVSFQPDLIGREEELEQLLRHLENAEQGKGQTILISGEAGIGKTRLLDELKGIAQQRGFQVLSGSCMFESLTPYMPILEALRSGDLESLFAEEAPRVEAVYLVTDTGILVREVLREATDLDPDIFASMLTTVGNFVKDTLSMMSGKEEGGNLNSLGYENHRILVETGRHTHLVVMLTGMENEFLIDDMGKVLTDVHKKYGEVLEDWDGDEAGVEGVDDGLASLMTSGKYDGLYYGLENPKARRNLLFENVSLGLIRKSQTMPTILCIEDLHWADPSSLAMIHYISRNSRKCGLVILGTYRPEDVVEKDNRVHPMVEMMQLMGREDLFTRLDLSRLRRESLEEFLSSMFGDCDFGDEFINRTYGETEGNPLFIIELMKLLVEENAVRTDNGTWRLFRDLEGVNMPSKIYDIVVRRLSRLQKEHRRVLDHASVIGEIFESGILSTSLDISRVRLLELLRELEQIHRLIHTYDGGFRFNHSKIKEVLYSEIPEELRREYHSVVASSIEALNKENLGEVVGDLAFHYLQCGNEEKALTYLIEAGKRAQTEYSNEEAARFYQEAARIEENEENLMMILETLGDIYDTMGEYDLSIESYNGAHSLVKEKGKRTEIETKIGHIHELKGDYDESIRICTEALSLVEGENTREEGLALQGIGFAEYRKGLYDKALMHLDDSYRIFEKIGDDAGMGLVLKDLGSVQIDTGHYGKALEYFQRSLRIAEGVGLLKEIASCYGRIGSAFSYLGEFQKAIEFYERSAEIEERIGGDAASPLQGLGNEYVKKREYRRALECLERSLSASEKSGNQMSISRSLLSIGGLHGERGDFKTAFEYCQKALEIRERIDDTYGVVNALLVIAHLHIKGGELKKAFNLGTRALQMADKYGIKTYVAGSHYILGIIYREEGKWEESRESLGKCIRIHKSLGREKVLADDYYELGLMWKKKGDLGKAKESLEMSIEIYEKLGFQRHVEEVGEVLSGLHRDADEKSI